ncbi:hypothetical protein KY290_036786 [Solanum tuberosum]|uniref:Uncharacterized protein n=1 Tax=Solanum tuberosum TaxID=4113 RepID=A0ABQ7TU52_SOLTU|nr:hypothetical protein KY289_036269 [Solanum tuberosum]KAH0639520.1 hypothetical protein KY285_036106 [Solanum tuberosum]KAH0727114.1 hypothetical protein KY284_002979 [Solanum tuberosum]KAH0738081.1 hypothetical protein KY290_036786 [Solanum tuberosum]
MACGDSLILLHFCSRDGINNSTNFKFRGIGESTSSGDGDRFRYTVTMSAFFSFFVITLLDINEEPVCPRPFSFDFEQPSFTEENIKELIWRESVNFNPDPTH